MENIPVSCTMTTAATATGICNFIILPTTATGTQTAFTLPAASLKPLAVITTATVNKPYTSTPPLKPAKKFRNEQEEILRCKRRLDFVSLGLNSLQRTQTVTISRRNERERNRVKLINNTFARLREHVPHIQSPSPTGRGKKAKKLSKVDTLRAAIDYIKGLQNLLDENDAVNAAFQSGYVSPALSPTLTPDDSINLPSPTAPSSCSGSETGGDDQHLSPEEHDLLDFASWFS